MLWKHEPQASVSSAISSSPKLSRVTLWKHRENVFYCFYEIKARSNFLCFHRVMVNSFEPIRARVHVVSCLFHKILFTCDVDLQGLRGPRSQHDLSGHYFVNNFSHN